MFCVNCGKEIKEVHKFCAYCGHANELKSIVIEETKAKQKGNWPVAVFKDTLWGGGGYKIFCI